MVVFVNYTLTPILAKKFRNYVSTVLFKFGKKKTRGKLLCNREINCKYIYPIYN